MGAMWSNNHLDQAILDRQDIMSAAQHSLLSIKGIFKGDCEAFTHILSQSKGNGYLSLCTAVHQVLRLCQRSDIQVNFRCCSTAILQLVQVTISDEMTHGNTSPSPIFHVRDAVNRTIWHLRTCHPNPARLVQLSKISTGIPHITHPQQIEKCSYCLIAKMLKVARGYDPAFEATVIGQGLALDVGFMFQRSKNKLRAELLTGINGCDEYCIV
jgi:hypothetical protein